MEDLKLRQLRFALISGIILSLFLVAMIYIFTSTSPGPELPGLKSEFLYFFSDNQKTVFELRSDSGFQIMQKNEKKVSNQKFGYLIVKLANENAADANLVIYNRAWNYYIEMLAPEKNRMVTVYQYGDKVPVSESPFRHSKASFPVSVAAHSESTYIVEFSSPAGIVIIPDLLAFSEFLRTVSNERLTMGILCGIFIFLLFINALNGILLRGIHFFPAVAFIGSVFFFFLRQSRLLLLLINPLVYPDWIFALSICLNILTVSIFIYMLMKDHLGRLMKVMLIVIGVSAMVCMTIGFFSIPYVVADILNILSLFLLIPAAYGLIVSLRKREFDTLHIVLSFIPWLAVVIIDITASISGIRLPVPAEYQQAPGMIASLILLSITLQNLHYKRYRKDIFNVERRMDKTRVEMDHKILEISELKTTVLHQLGYQLRQPLDSILALVSIAEKNYTEPAITSVWDGIASEADELKRIIDSGFMHLEEELGVGTEAPVNVISRLMPDTQPWVEASVCIFDFNEEHSARTALILRASGYDVRIVSEQYQILSLINAGKVDVLIIDPVSTGESAFALCRLIRAEYNIFEVPVLMITSYHADYIMNKGYGAGVNDFLTRPFDASELSARVQSLIKLKNIAKHNNALAKSEKEKNTFLYFLTHNVNTPLTLLLNRIQELSGYRDMPPEKDLVDDLLFAVKEINDIVQNVLISFRLSDGRHTVRFSRLDIEKISWAVKDDLASKAAEKQQVIKMAITGRLPAVSGDYSAVKGIVYNLADNAIKFSPIGGTVSIEVTSGDYVEIAVRDSGPGVAKEERHFLFERFQRLSAQPTAGESSTGLGLYVAHELAKLNGGFLEYREQNSGACFVFGLPGGMDRDDE